MLFDLVDVVVETVFVSLVSLFRLFAFSLKELTLNKVFL